MTNYRRKAKRKWPRAWLGEDSGRYALVLPCRDFVVRLRPTLTKARSELRSIGSHCGSNCWGTDKHYIVDLESGRRVTQ